MELNDLILDVFNLECKFFMKTDSYRLIEQKCRLKFLLANERQLLNIEIHSVFTRLIKTMTEACPSLTNDDLVFCCLEKSGLDYLVVCHCMGNVSKKPENQRKYRIKKKMKEANSEELFEVIFAT